LLAYLPMAWIGEHIFSYAEAYCAGFCASCPESQATVMVDLRELGPTFFFAPPRVFENILTQVMIRMEDAAWAKRKLFHYFLGIAKRFGLPILDQQGMPFVDRLLYWLGELLVYGPLKNALGLSRVRIAYTAGEAIGPDLFVFYRSLGINLKQLYGMTESSVFLCIQKDGEVKPDTVGPPVEGVEIRIAEDGEVLFKSPGAFQSYYKNPEATAETKRADGWVHTGDSGFFDANGHLKIIDRAKDVGRLENGSLFAPKYLENKLKFFSWIKEAVVFGNGRPFVAAFLNLDLEAVGDWAGRRNLAYASYQELAAQNAVYDLLQGCVEQVNHDLAAEQAIAGAQIRRFLILYKELDADDGELTRTRKVRRRIIAARYQPLIEALYSGRQTGHIETEITFEDGRKGRMKAELMIRDVPTSLPVVVEQVPFKKAS
jgi:long-chain acyl-CoA synthetase